MTFHARIDIIGINPHVLLPEAVLQFIFTKAKKNRGSIPVRVTIDGHPFPQTLVKYSGKWRLYLNQPMRTAAGKEVGDRVEVSIAYDPLDRTIKMHPKLKVALDADTKAKQILSTFSPSRQQEIIKYIARLKTEASVDKNVNQVIEFLHGRQRFLGREGPSGHPRRTS